MTRITVYFLVSLVVVGIWLPGVLRAPISTPAPRVAPSLQAVAARASDPIQIYDRKPSISIGMLSVLVIPVEFSDVKHVAPKAAIQNLVFSKMAAYYYQVSYGALRVVGNVTDWILLHHSMSYYGADGKEIDDSDNDGKMDSYKLIQDAVAASEPIVDFSRFQSILVMHSGNGQESESDKTNDIWSVYYNDLSIVTQKGEVITAAAIVPESEHDGGLEASLGVVAHEFGHSLGLPDLYDEMDNTARDYVGPWSLMAKGTWLGNPEGSAPSELEAYSRNLLGWLPIQELKQATSVYLSPLEWWNGTKAVRIPAPNTDMYYLVEVRRRIGYDASLPEEGVLITIVRPTRESGLGILKVVDTDPADTKLNHAPFHHDDTYGDENHGVFFTLSAQGAGFVVTLSPAPIVYTTIAPSSAVAAYGSFGTFTGQVNLGGLTNQNGLTVTVSYLTNSRWVPLGSGATDWQGVASFKLPVKISPGQYRLLYDFAGATVDGRFLWPSNSTTTLIVTQGVLRISVQAKDLYAFQTQTVRARISDEFDRPVANVSTSFFVNDRLIGKTTTNPSGYATIASCFDLRNVGNQNLRLEVDGGTNYTSSRVSMIVAIVVPAWFYQSVVTALLAIGIIAVAVISVEGRISIARWVASCRPESPRMKYCIYCGQPIRKDARFCTNIKCGLQQQTT